MELAPGEYMRRMLHSSMLIVYRCSACHGLIGVDVHQVSGTGRSLKPWCCPTCKDAERHVQLLDYEPA